MSRVEAWRESVAMAQAAKKATTARVAGICLAGQALCQNGQALKPDCVFPDYAADDGWVPSSRWLNRSPGAQLAMLALSHWTMYRARGDCAPLRGDLPATALPVATD